MSASDKKKLRKEQDAAALTEKQLSQKKEDKQLRAYTLTFIVVMVLVAAIAVGSMAFTWYGNSGIPARNTTALTIGDYKLSNADLNYYFMDTVNQFYNESYNSYGTYAPLYVQMYTGLDMTKALNAQSYNENTGETWADYFMKQAIASAEATYALYTKAMEDNFSMSDEQEVYLNAVLAKAVADAGRQGYASFEKYLKAFYGNGATEETYVNYFRINNIADAYYSKYADGLTYTAEQIKDHNDENYDKFSAFDYSYYYVNVKSFLPALEEGTEATAEQREEARIAAKEAADQLATAKDLVVLNKLISAMEINKDKPTAAATEINGTSIGSVASLYSQWIADQSRTAGDTTVVEFESESDDDELVDGYYVVLFEGRKDFNEKMRSVRHILVKFEGGTKDDDNNTVYSEEEKKAAYDEAKALYDEWLAGDATEESFAALATSEHSDDGGSNTNGGLYTHVYKGAMVENFDAWLFDESRQPGDHGIVETEIGYHVMFFVGEEDQTYREYAIEATLRDKDVSAWYSELLEDVTSVKGDTQYINTGLVLAQNVDYSSLFS